MLMEQKKIFYEKFLKPKKDNVKRAWDMMLDLYRPFRMIQNSKHRYEYF